MGSLLEAVNASPNKIEVTNQLPTKVGGVSIMTLDELHVVLDGSVSSIETVMYDSSAGYNSSTYFVYGITGTRGINSTPDNLQSVGINWYQRLNKPTEEDSYWMVGSHKVFGGPLHYIVRFKDGSYYFLWYYTEDRFYGSQHSNYWYTYVPGSVYVAVVRAHE